MRKKLRIFYIFVTVILLNLFFSNCAAKYETLEGSSKGSAASIACEQDLIKTFKQQVHPFLNSDTACKNCHVEGGIGLGAFASDDSNTAYEVFKGVGLSKISLMATSNHKVPYTGTQHEKTINNLNILWPKAENEYLECVAAAENGGVKESFLTASKDAPLIYRNDVEQTLTWDLENAADLPENFIRTVPAIFSVNIKILYQTVNNVKIVQGYIFSNPKIKLKSSQQQYIVEGLYVYINDKLISNQTTYVSVSKVISSTLATDLLVAKANTLIDPVDSTDRFAFYFRRLVPTSEEGDGYAPATPLLSLYNNDLSSTVFTNTIDIKPKILKDNGVSRWCITNNPTPPANTEAPCVGSENKVGTINGWELGRPTTHRLAFTDDDADNNPESNDDGEKTVYLWVANSNLMINSTPASAKITLDTTRPAAATISGLSVTDTQVASLTITNGSDVKGWCVVEQNSVVATPTGRPNLNDDCWKWSYDGTKPTNVGFKDGGNRKVFVFVRDEAGNVSDISNVLTANNPFGPITFSQLTGAAGNERAVFTNHCSQCHQNPENPGYKRFRLFDYTEAVARGDSGLLVSRTNNPLSPMPNIDSGLMAKKYRDLIRLWTMENDDGRQFEP